MQKIIYVSLAMLGLCASVSSCNPKPSEIFSLEDLSSDVKEYFVTQNKVAPGKVCGKFKPREKGCILLLKNKKGMAASIVYQSSGRKKSYDTIETLSPPVNYIFIEKFSERKIQSSLSLPEDKEFNLAPWQDAVILNYFEKSAVAYFWNGDKFMKIWISD